MFANRIFHQRKKRIKVQNNSHSPEMTNGLVHNITVEEATSIQCTVKQIRRFYGKIPGNQLPVHIPLFLRASARRTFLEIKKW